MDRPERIKLITTLKTIKELNENIGNLNYNRAIDDYETWLKEAMSVEKIEKTIKKHFRISTQWDSEELAKEIHKHIGK